MPLAADKLQHLSFHDSGPVMALCKPGLVFLPGSIPALVFLAGLDAVMGDHLPA